MNAILHKGVCIEYDENTNKWVFTLRGRERACDSLKAAKESIDRPAAEKRNAFEPIRGWMVDWSGTNITPGRVTSFSLAKYGRERINFVETDEKETTHMAARKEDFDNFFPKTEANEILIAMLRAYNAEIGRVRELKEKSRANLKRIDKAALPQ